MKKRLQAGKLMQLFRKQQIKNTSLSDTRVKHVKLPGAHTGILHKQGITYSNTWHVAKRDMENVIYLRLLLPCPFATLLAPDLVGTFHDLASCMKDDTCLLRKKLWSH